MAESIKNNYLSVLESIEKSARMAGRPAADVKLVVVTKGQPLEKIRAVLAAGATRLGENYAEEAIAKIQDLPPGMRPEWHMIGHIQSRKARIVSEYFDWVHSLDSVRLAARLNKYAETGGRSLPVLLEFNISGEPTKSGFPAWEKSMWPALLAEIAAIVECKNLQINGLMVVPPYDPEPEASRPYFRLARELREYLGQNYPREYWRELSMGMSNDYQVAIQEGATIVRLGQAILGERQS
jgi:hypothetical protein